MGDEVEKVALVDLSHFLSLADKTCRVLQELSGLTEQVPDQLTVLHCCKEVGHHSWVFDQELEAVVLVTLALLDAGTASTDVVETECTRKDAWFGSIDEDVFADQSQPIQLL